MTRGENIIIMIEREELRHQQSLEHPRGKVAEDDNQPGTTKRSLLIETDRLKRGQGERGLEIQKGTNQLFTSVGV